MPHGKCRTRRDWVALKVCISVSCKVKLCEISKGVLAVEGRWRSVSLVRSHVIERTGARTPRGNKNRSAATLATPHGDGRRTAEFEDRHKGAL